MTVLKQISRLGQSLSIRGLVFQGSAIRLLAVVLMGMISAVSMSESAMAKPNIKGLRVKPVDFSALPGLET